MNGGTCFDPLMFHFPLDEQTFTNTEHSFIFANALKITPVLDAKTSESNQVSSYFPKGTWVSMNNYSQIVVSEGGE
jgi:alpha-glucosidase (family GH31 glycosyl hydrolase)